MKQEVEKHLSEIIIPFWSNLKDDEFGGYYGWMNEALEVDKKAVKGSILHVRILWFFSNAYLHLKTPELLEQAQHAYKFVKEQCLDKNHGGLFWDMTYDGTANDTTKHTYCQSFGVYALASYYNASGDEEALEEAMKLFGIIETHCKDDYGYLEAFDQKFQPVSNEKLSENGVEAAKTMNTLLHVFEAYTELYRVSKAEEVAESMRYILAIFLGKVYNTDLKRLEVFFDREMNSIIDLHSYGHDIEAAWLLDRGCQVLEDDYFTSAVASMTSQLTENVYKLAYKEGSLLNENEHGIDDTNRIWWVQAEAVVGFTNAYRANGSNHHYKEAAESIWAYIKSTLIDKRQGSEWFWGVDEQGVPIEGKPMVEPWKCPYHNGRMCFEVLTSEVL